MKRFLPLALLGLSATSFGQNLVVNGDFSLSVPSNGSGNGWTSFNIDGSGGWRSTGGNPNGVFLLNDAGSGATNPTIEQTLTLVVGQTYTVSGQWALGNAGYGGGTDKDFGVEIDGNLWEYTVPVDVDAWRSFSETFVATSSSATLRLTGERHADHDPRIDNISVQAVPEPATMAALSLGVFGLLRRRRASGSR